MVSRDFDRRIISRLPADVRSSITRLAYLKRLSEDVGLTPQEREEARALVARITRQLDNRGLTGARAEERVVASHPSIEEAREQLRSFTAEDDVPAPERDVVERDALNIAEESLLINPASATTQIADLVVEASDEQPVRATAPTYLSLNDGCADRLSDILWLSGFRDEPTRISIDFFVRVLISLCGSEVEANEITLACVVGPRPWAGGVLGPGPDLHVTTPIKFAQSREAISFIREVIGSEADGGPGSSLALFSPGNGDFFGLTQPSLGTDQRDADVVLRQITRDLRYQGFLIRPADTVRAYLAGTLHSQVIRVRDGLGWAIRVVDELVDSLLRVADHTVQPDVARQVVEVLLSFSEARTGAAIYIVPDSLDLADDRVKDEYSIARCLVHPDQLPIELQMDRVRNRCRQDGAVIVSSRGLLLASRTYFRSQGGRRKTAEEIAARHGVIGCVVSQDGPIYLSGAKTIVVDAQRYV